MTIATESDTKASEESTYVVTASFTDEDDNAVSPDTLTWSLVNGAGTVVNERDSVSVASPSSSEDIVLSGDDLALEGNLSQETRYLVIEATYTSNAGSGLPLKAHLKFYIQDIKKVS